MSPVVPRREPPGSPVRKEPPRSPVLIRREPLSCGSGSIKKQHVPISHYHPVTFNAVPSPPSVPFNPCVPQKKYASVRFNPSKERVIESLPASDCAEQSSVPPQPVNPAPSVAVPALQPPEVAPPGKPETVPAEPEAMATEPKAAPAPVPTPTPAPVPTPAPAPAPVPGPSPPRAQASLSVTVSKSTFNPVAAPESVPEIPATNPAPVVSRSIPRPPKPPKSADVPRAPTQPQTSGHVTLEVSETMRMVHKEDRERSMDGGPAPHASESLELLTVHAKTFERKR